MLAQNSVLYIAVHKGMLCKVTVRKMSVDGITENGMEHSRNTVSGGKIFSGMISKFVILSNKN